MTKLGAALGNILRFLRQRADEIWLRLIAALGHPTPLAVLHRHELPWPFVRTGWSIDHRELRAGCQLSLEIR